MFKPENISISEGLNIFNHSGNAVALFSDQCTTFFYNQLFIEYFSNLNTKNDFFSQAIFYEKKFPPVKLDLFKKLTTFNSSELLTLSIDQVWIKVSESNHFIPVSLELSKVFLDKKINILLVIKDLKLNTLNHAQLNLIENHFSGNFITDSNGFITQPNLVFCEKTALTKEKLKKLRYIDWLKQQVSFETDLAEVISTMLLSRAWSGCVNIYNAKGEVFKVTLSLSMLIDTKNNIEHFVGVLEELTEEKAIKASNLDPLTGLQNQKSLKLNLLKYSKLKQDELYCMLILGLNNFNDINQNYGSETGDKLLIKLAEKIKSSILNDTSLSKIDGANFAILFNTKQKNYLLAKEETHKKALSLLSEIEGVYQLSENTFHSSFSAGICLFPFKGLEKDSQPSDRIINFASMALQKSRRKGEKLYFFDKNLQNKTSQYLELVEALNTSELDDEFQLYFQGQADKTGKIISAETLLRWIHPKLGMIPPSKFIAIAEEGKQIIKIGLWVLHKAFIQTYLWNKINAEFRVSINISPVQFHEPNFVEIIIGLLKFTQVNPKNITLELTEGVFIKDSQLTLQKIKHLVALGFEISIDDFGTGYSSLSYLQKLPLHELKIDQSFIAHLRENPDDDAIVDSIIQLAKNKNLKVVAEGVETRENADTLIEKSPEILLQGYFFSKPVPIQEFEESFLRT